jgi:hypothetical protein
MSLSNDGEDPSIVNLEEHEAFKTEGKHENSAPTSIRARSVGFRITEDGTRFPMSESRSVPSCSGSQPQSCIAPHENARSSAPATTRRPPDARLDQSSARHRPGSPGAGWATLRLPVPSRSEGDGLAPDMTHAQSACGGDPERVPVLIPQMDIHGVAGILRVPNMSSTARDQPTGIN